MTNCKQCEKYGEEVKAMAGHAYCSDCDMEREVEERENEEWAGLSDDY